MRTFYTSTNGCCELALDSFPDESTQHKWFEKNLHVLFPDLKLVKRKMQISKKIPDTVAYDSASNTFVAIEYKNRRSDTVREQAEDYLNMMKDNHDALIVKYNDLPNITRRSHDSFEWKKMYVIIIAPEFNDRQISNAKRKDDECLYELKKFENGFVTLRFMAGKRGPIDNAKRESGGGDDAGVILPPNPSNDEKPLTAFERVKSADCPKYLVRPDKRVPLQSWKAILVSVADYLITNKHIDKSHCPIKSGPKNAILNIKPVHQNGRQFKTNKEVHGLYLDTWLSAAGSIQRSIELINKAGVSLDDFKLSDSS